MNDGHDYRQFTIVNALKPSNRYRYW